jgi:hypothetical protein
MTKSQKSIPRYPSTIPEDGNEEGNGLFHPQIKEQSKSPYLQLRTRLQPGLWEA